MKGEPVFALDIGTRSVVGVVVERNGEKVNILGAELEEHSNRSMLDGQIHDVPQVTEVVKRVRARLEKKVGFSLGQVAVAAAGRALKTARGVAERDCSPLEEITSEEVLAWEIEAVHEAQKSLLERDREAEEYPCVGYSVVNFYLDGSVIGNLVGQHGNRVGVEVLATFLPRVVVDSLYSVLQRAGLEMHSLTLEPIAAINVAVPSTMRRLNLALVDVGAGTSDIAVTADGTIIGYAMVPAAGDEITEHLCRDLLLDFTEGERIKRLLSSSEEVTYTDAVGVKHRASSQDLISLVEPTVAEIAGKIGEKILEINRQPPQAVICIGGGSLTPGLARKIAETLNLPHQRVAVRGREILEQVTGAWRKLQGPQAVTPLGIAITALERKSMGFTNIRVNNRPVRLFNIRGGKVADALVAAGVNVRKLYGRPGMGISVIVNGEVKFLKGTMGKAAEIAVNGEPATLDTEISAGDNITVKPAEDGKDAAGTIADVVPALSSKKIVFNGKEVELKPLITMNGAPVSYRTPLVDKATINYRSFDTVEEVLNWLKHPLKAGERILVNGREADLYHSVEDGDVLEIRSPEEEGETTRVVVNGKELAIRHSRNRAPILTDVFRQLDFEPHPPEGKKKFVLIINGKPATFTTPLKEGDQIEITWQ
ncbi:cell division protein FtsA [Calderihabitans maritimus]|uniref:cell division protein FtsA n=1 Tax=Calderihabitans maritimus TaxID=1246530 RepID=UPI0018647ACE|nr:cell division FtsA domain-containing protein [Calderihabitans maritimus]